MSGYHVGHNVPGYLSDNEPYHVETWSDALAVLRSDVEDGLEYLPWDDSNGGYEPGEREAEAEYIEALEDMNTLEDGIEVTYVLPTSTSEWDLGRAYWIALCTEDNCTEGNE